MTQTTNRLIVFMSQPIFSKNGIYRGILSGTFYLQENNILSMIFGDNNVDDSGSYYYIVDSSGHLLYHPDKQLIGEDVSNNKVVQKLMNGRVGNSKCVTPVTLKCLPDTPAFQPTDGELWSFRRLVSSIIN